MANFIECSVTKTVFFQVILVANSIKRSVTTTKFIASLLLVEIILRVTEALECFRAREHRDVPLEIIARGSLHILCIL